MKVGQVKHQGPCYRYTHKRPVIQRTLRIPSRLYGAVAVCSILSLSMLNNTVEKFSIALFDKAVFCEL
jgi:hypothetical protein